MVLAQRAGEELYASQQDLLTSADAPNDEGLATAITGLLEALKMRSEDLDRSSSTTDDDIDAPVADPTQLDLTQDHPAPAAEPAPQLPAFYREHNIDPSSLPAASSPPRDDGVTFAGLLQDCQPVGILELSLVSSTTEVPAGQTSVSVHVQDLHLMGRLVSDGAPDSLGTSFGVRLHIKDTAGEELHLVVKDADSGMSAADFAAHVAAAYPKGTSVALSGFDLLVLGGSFVVILDKSRDDAAFSFLGDDALPETHLFQVSMQCSLLVKADKFNAMAARAISGLKEARPHLGRTVVPLLTNLAVAHLRLGQDSIALAYGVSLQQLLFQTTPAKAACIVSFIMQKRGHSEAACTATAMGHFESGDPLEWVEAVGNEGFKVLSRVGERNVEDHGKKAIKAGLRQMADALVDAQGTWMDHALGKADAVEHAAAHSQAKHGKAAADWLKKEGDRLFQSGASARFASFKRSRTQKAILKWRAALWLQLDRRFHLAGYSAWDILDVRHRHWDKAVDSSEEGPQAPVLHFLDLAALAMMRAGHVNTTALRRNLVKAACALGHWPQALGRALEDCTSDLGIMT